MMPERLINVVKALLPYIVVAGVVALGSCKYNHDISTSRQEGFDAGVTHQKGVQLDADNLEGARREAEKERLERSYQARLESMSADLSFSNDALKRMQQTTTDLRELLSHATGVESHGTSTIEIARVLTDLYSESVREYNLVAEEAERYRISGTQCELQYDAVRNTHATESKTVDHSTN